MEVSNFSHIWRLTDEWINICWSTKQNCIKMHMYSYWVVYMLIYKYIFSNYWMRLSRIWRILQIKEGVIHRGRRTRWITPSEICRILNILWKLNSITALLFFQNISPFLEEFHYFVLCFSAHQNNTTLSPGFLGQQFNNLQRAALLTSFWRHWFNNFQRAALLMSLVQYFGQQQLVVVNYVCSFNQSETEKYFEWIISIDT